MARLSAAVVTTLLAAGLALAAGDSCPTGWTGRGCTQCTTDKACADEGKGDSCWKEIAFAPGSEDKTFACKILDATLSSYIVPDSVVLQCYGGGSNQTMAPGHRHMLGDRLLLEAGGAGSCDISLQTATLLGGSLIQCTGVACDIEDGTTAFSCAKATCKCSPADCGSPMIAGIVGQISGKAGLDCDENGNCAISLSLPIVGNGGIKAKCTAAECIYEM